MVIGEALTRRADLQKRIAQLEQRLRSSVLVQEGDEPPESCDDLLAELDSLCGELQLLISRINHSNSRTGLSTGETVTDALARRDVLALRQGTLRATVRAAVGETRLGPPRYSRSEIRMVRQIRVSEIQRQIDELAKEQRELDTILQGSNWTTSVID